MAKRWLAVLLTAGLTLLCAGAQAGVPHRLGAPREGDVPAATGTPAPEMIPGAPEPETATDAPVWAEWTEMPLSPDATPEEMPDATRAPAETSVPEPASDASAAKGMPDASTEPSDAPDVAAEPSDAPMPSVPDAPESSGNGETAPASTSGERVTFTLMRRAQPLAGVKIGIDPGHQARGNSERETVAPGSSETKAKVSSGTTGVATRIPEYVTVLEISLKLRDALASQGAEVYMTRETHDVNLSNQERAQMMNALGVDLVLRIHCDGAENHAKHGIALYCSRSNYIAGESYRAAEAILPRVCEATGAQANGIVQNDSYTGQNWSTVPCVMVECGFLSNPDEDVLLNDEDYQWKIATGLTNGIIDYIDGR